jgi:hypothetical protein
MIPALAIILAQAAQPGANSQADKMVLRERTGSSALRGNGGRVQPCNQLRELNTEIARSSCKRVERPEIRVSPTEPPAPPNLEKTDTGSTISILCTMLRADAAELKNTHQGQDG